MHELRSSVLLRGTALLLMMMLAGGCGGGTRKSVTGSVSGSVTMQGQPVSGARVGFFNKETGAGAGAELDASGNFSIPEVEVGTYTVTVHPAMQAPTPDAGPQAGADIPQKYRSDDSTPLTAEVKEGSNELPPFELEP